MANWKKGFQPSVATAALESWIIRDGPPSEGSLKLRGLGFSREKLLLAGMIEFSESMPESQRSAIVSQSVTHVANRGELSHQKILMEVSRREKLYRNRPAKKYRLHTTISISSAVNIPRTYFSGSYISVGGRLRANTARAREELIRRYPHAIPGTYPGFYLPVAVTTSGKTPDEAALTALDRLNYVRGLWNIQLNRGSYRESFGRPDPVNMIVLGPVHTLHELTGELSVDQFWYDDSYRSPVSLFADTDRAQYFLEYAKKVLRIDKIHPYSTDLRTAVTRYAEVLDSRDMNATILGLWGILEFITDTKDKNYDVLIRRAAFVFEDYEKSKEILRHLRNRRNEYAHGGTTTSGAEILVHQLKNFVEKLIGFHLGVAEKFIFRDIREFAAMLDLPSNEKALSRRKRLVAFAHELRFGDA